MLNPYEQLEHDFAHYMGYRPEQMVACSSGTAALHLAFEALRLPLGSEVIMSDLNMIACPRAVVLAGLKPVFVDCDDNLLIGTTDGVRTRQSSCILATHVYGRVCDMSCIHKEAEPHMLAVIEDMAEAHGVRPHADTDAVCHSFYKNKVICGEEGGCVAFKDVHHAHHARQLRSLGFTETHDFTHVPRGHNYRMSNLHAWPILTSLKAVEKNLVERNYITSQYDSCCPHEWRMPQRQSNWVYDIRLPHFTRELQDRAVTLLRQSGIEARHCFKPMSDQEEYRSSYHRPTPVAHLLSQQVIYLPIRPFETRMCDIQMCFDILNNIT